jgi:RNA polymerase sigma-70 factor, ECF subfamily
VVGFDDDRADVGGAVIGSEFDEVLTAARNGDDQAVGMLWRDLHPPLLRYLRGLEPGAAEDVESETWLQAARDLHRFEGTEIEFRAWMFTIARHRLVDWRRMAARRPSVTRDPIDLPETSTARDAADEALEHLDTDAALDALSTLAPDQAEVILLRVLGGLDVERVASIMGKRPGTVRVLQHRGLRRLAAALAHTAGTDTRGVTR